MLLRKGIIALFAVALLVVTGCQSTPQASQQATKDTVKTTEQKLSGPRVLFFSSST